MRIAALILFSSLCLPGHLVAQDEGSETPKVQFETSMGEVTCNLVTLDSGEAALADCVFADETALTTEQKEELGLTPPSEE